MKPTALFAATMAAIVAVFASSFPPAESDLFWHLESGDWMLENGRLLLVDQFSHTRAGESYWAGQWLGQVVYALVHRTWGWVGIDLLRGLLVGLAAFFLTRAVLRVQPHPGWAFGPVLAALLVSKPFWGDRPQLFTLALFVVFLDVLLAARLERKVHRLWLLPPLMLLWANLHGVFILGLILLAVFALEALVSRVDDLRVPLIAVTIGSFVASLANPATVQPYLTILTYSRGDYRLAIVEERPPSLESAFVIAFVVLLGAAVVATALRRGRGAAWRLDAPMLWMPLFAAFGYLGANVQRLLPYAAFVLAPYVAGVTRAALGRRVDEPDAIDARLGRPLLVVLAAIAIASSFVVAPRDADLSAYPRGAEALLGDHGKLLNEYDWGGYLIRFAPQAPTFIDGRGIVLFPSEVLDEYQTAINVREGYRDILAGRDIGQVLLRPERPLVGVLLAEGWLVVGEGERWILLRRPGPRRSSA